MRLFNKKNLSSFISHFSFQKGFTLIELLIVIAIIGILAAALLIAINPGQRIASAKNARVKSDLVSLGSLANIYNTDTGIKSCTGAGYPTTMPQTAAGCTGTAPTFPSAPVSPGSAYTISGSLAAIGIEGPSFNDGVTTTEFGWCWRSATGQTELQPLSTTTCP